MNIFDKYPYIVIEGPIGCGKSTLASLLAQKIERPFLMKRLREILFYLNFTRI